MTQDMPSGSIAPSLLLAMPQLPDPNFRRSVCLMVEHGDEETWGLIVNRPSDLAVREVLDQLELPWQGEADAVVWEGGPVEPQRGCVIHSPPVGEPLREETGEIAPGILLSTLPDQLRELAERPPVYMRFLLGYAGWAPGQIELEMAAGSWLVAPVSTRLVFETAAEEMWEAAIRSLGVDLAALVPGAGVH